MKIFTVLAILSVCLSAQGQAAPHAAQVKVGVVLRAVPEVNSFASDLNQGIELAAEQFNRDSKNLKVELVHYPYQNEKDALEKAAKKLIADQVRFVIGGEMSDEALSLSESFKSSSVLFMSPTASHPTLARAGDLNFRGSYSDDELAKAVARFVIQSKPNARIGILHNSGNAYSDYLTTAFQTEFSKSKQNKSKFVPVIYRYSSEDPDFNAAAQKFKDAKVDLVIGFVLQEALKNFVHSAESIQYQPEYGGGDGWGTDESILKAMPRFRGFRNAYWHPESKAPALLKFTEQFENKFGQKPNAWNAVAYDSALALFESIEKSLPQLSAEKVAAQLTQIRVSKSVTVPGLHFDHSHTAVRPFFWYELSEGKSHFLKEMKP